MLYSIKNNEYLEQVEELASLQVQVEEVKLPDKLGKQNFHENVKNLYKPLTDTIRDTSRVTIKTVTETCNKNNKALEKLNEKI